LGSAGIDVSASLSATPEEAECKQRGSSGALKASQQTELLALSSGPPDSALLNKAGHLIQGFICKKQEARSKKQEARSKKQEARSKKQEARSKKQEDFQP